MMIKSKMLVVAGISGALLSSNIYIERAEAITSNPEYEKVIP